MPYLPRVSPPFPFLDHCGPGQPMAANFKWVGTLEEQEHEDDFASAGTLRLLDCVLTV